MDDFADEHVWPILLTWTDLVFMALSEEEHVVVFRGLETSKDNLVAKVEKLADLIHELPRSKLDHRARRHLDLLNMET